MPLAAPTPSVPLSVRQLPWPAPQRAPSLSNDEDARPEPSLTGNAHNTPQDPRAVHPQPLDDVRIQDGVPHMRLPRHALVTVTVPVL